MINTLAGNSLLILFLIAASGFLLGRIRIAGFSLGVAGVLFAGIAAGAAKPPHACLSPRFRSPGRPGQCGGPARST